MQSIFMNEKSYANMHSMSDEAIEKEIGLFVKRVRQEQNKTQKDIATAANISRSTLSLLERGESGSLKTLIQLLRVLDKLQTFEVFKYREVLSPLALAKAQHQSKERVRRPKETKDTDNKQKTSW